MLKNKLQLTTYITEIEILLRDQSHITPLLKGKGVGRMIFIYGYDLWVGGRRELA